MKEIVFLNGNFLSKGRARISPDDRGFNFADGVYEVVKFYGGKPFRWDDHLMRLSRSLTETGIRYQETNRLAEVCDKLLQLNGLSGKNSGVYLQITRGSHKRVHHFPDGIEPTVYITVYGMPPFTEKLEKGIRVITHEDIRWLRCDIKSVSLLPNIMLYQKAIENGADECILVRDGMVTEATHSSVIGIRNNSLVTHPRSRITLHGITGRVVEEICTRNGIPFIEEPVREEDIQSLDELFITGTGSEIMPVVQVDDKKIKDGLPGPMTRFIQRRFFELTYGELAGEPCWWDWR